jgi:cyclopropane fatty-acyl-phospholipid synthase-like methyltransferase
VDELAALFDELGAGAADASDVDAYFAHLPRNAGALLVAGGDAGRLLVALAQRGLHVHGVESTPSKLQRCEARLRAAGHDTPVFRQELDALNLPFRYAGALIAAKAWQMLDPLRIDAAVASVRAHLVTPGMLLLQAFIADDAQHPPGAPIVEIERVKLEDASVITRRCERRIDAEAQTFESIERYERRVGTDVVAREDVTIRSCWRTPEEMLALLLATGFAQARIEEIGSTRPGRSYVIVASL